MITLLTGDVRDVLPTLPDASVQCVVTSPPYYGLRDYGTAQWEGGDAECDHTMQRSVGASTLMNDGRTNIGLLPDHKYATVANPFRAICGKCGAHRIDSQIGLEATPDDYIATMVAVFREVRRIMRDDATCWINLGDSFSGKQLLMMPARLALALQADGWWLRSDIIWAKPNPMPESVTDRPTNAHEHVFLLTRSGKYFYDADAVREAHTDPDQYPANGAKGIGSARHELRRDAGRSVGGRSYSTAYLNPAGRNLRNVWTIATAPFPEAHFATFPPALAERCIKAGTSERGCCAACGAPWVRTTERAFVPQPDVSRQRGVRGAFDQKPTYAAAWDSVPRGTTSATTTGWSPACQCNADTKPCVVLDPFSGAGTALLVADRLGRDAIGIDLSHAYVEMSRKRLEADCPLFADISDAPMPEHPEEYAIADLFAEAAE